MLVISRKAQESVTIGDSIKIVVLDWNRGRVRIGIVAPKHVPIVRQELDSFTAERIKANAEASK